ncbi:hypothetical protein ACFP2F_01965 [Hymenobacter artigasi]|uniref:Uncharacterized protein n=1 Tax=Hymenobacter artigasi TaxID=2719616 RepID=A0ABX1HFN1_9BACT|nr:hypothetical protein [Hymenobacter artigasi]NKI87816.1 hypothetical protein [Hymenobacter artigasi]
MHDYLIRNKSGNLSTPRTYRAAGPRLRPRPRRPGLGPPAPAGLAAHALAPDDLTALRQRAAGHLR